jgi:hypothetical protein
MEGSLTKKPKRLRLYNALKIGYLRNEKKQARMLKKFGYILDTELTNPRENIVAYSPFDKKLLYISNGTDFRNVEDVGNDALILLGSSKEGKRVQDEKQLLTKAREKYKNSKLVMASHSLGSQIQHDIAPAEARVVTYNPAYSFNQKVRPNFENYRTQGDIISTFAPKANTTILENPNPQRSQFNAFANILSAHDTDNLRNVGIFL